MAGRLNCTSGSKHWVESIFQSAWVQISRYTGVVEGFERPFVGTLPTLRTTHCLLDFQDAWQDQQN